MSDKRFFQCYSCASGLVRELWEGGPRACMCCGAGAHEGTPYERTHYSETEYKNLLSYEEGSCAEIYPRLNTPCFKSVPKLHCDEDLYD